MEDLLVEILSSYGKSEKLIPILQQLQVKFGYLSKAVMLEIARFKSMLESRVFGVATFNNQLYFTQRGEHMVKVCLDTTTKLEMVEGELSDRI
ncbi:NADH-quinone oxidoreductase subunit E [Candidatus Hakubella thermalkaliphila]|uniref:NADH-quinone oxidoreductase subunit E n=1 Tax=Candidatus Hakubella thermalkaliphila TaxID=2754717 RepID=A0A6V8PST0_9ACTN|nr:NAD(P)H-dependent oxidoreductase subunit E [Candidatus Hakubella thermalkaliphila]GFP21820.1 NADH-quinone oxidoreductase subunit E [Candidatus Hakubella thermalkaliphila]GFP35170.1 NADH-quinone oxidoreductase subunit E [Candidatus Hakubella thermalkaliphila]GFP43985.1 NADH-quinone oxidoreductase subunit E [Candidatus Hakubella thermalkaliphila]